jgi:hypothetical protein
MVDELAIDQFDATIGKAKILIVSSLAPEHESWGESCHHRRWETAGERSQYVWRSHPVA